MRKYALARKYALVIVSLLLLSCGGAGTGGPVAVRQTPDPSGYRGAVPAEAFPLPGGTFADTAGRAYNLRSTPSRPVILLQFGYTNCPDVCGSVLADMQAALSRLGPAERDEVGYLFVSVDPARDSPEVLRAYLDRFDATFVGLTAEPGTVKRVAADVGVDVMDGHPVPGGYEVVHAAQVTAFDEDRRAAVIWTPGTPVADVTADLRLLVRRQH